MIRSLALYLFAGFLLVQSPTEKSTNPVEKTPASGKNKAGAAPKSGAKPALRFKKKDPNQSEPASKSKVADSDAPEVPDRNIPKPPDAKQEKPNDLDTELLNELDRNATEKASSENPLLRAGRRMQEAQVRLAKLEANEDTITLQNKIVKDLDELLKQKQQNSKNKNQKKRQQQKKDSRKDQQREQNSRQQAKQGDPKNEKLSDSGQQVGGPRSVREEFAAVIEAKDIWGHLGAMAPQERSQYSKESYLPKYREILEQYYLTLATKSKNKKD